MMVIKPIHEKISQFWVFCIVLIYSLVMSEYFNSVSIKITFAQGKPLTDSIYSYMMTLNFSIVILSAFVVWLVSSFLFHMFATLLGGDFSFMYFRKYTGLCYIFPAIGFLIALFLFERIELPKDNIAHFFKSDKSMILINRIINISSSLCFILPIPIVKYLYQVNWIEAAGAIVIPIGSIYLLSLFFGNYIL